MKTFKNGTIILIIGVVGLLVVIGAVLYAHFDYLKPAASYTPQEISASEIELININTATVEELSKLPGLSNNQAQSIIDYREENGSFTSTEELLNIKGIGKKAYEKIALYITAK